MNTVTRIASSYEEWKNFGGKILSSPIVSKRKRDFEKIHCNNDGPIEEEFPEDPILPENSENQNNYANTDQKPRIANVQNCHHSEGNGCLSLDCWYIFC